MNREFINSLQGLRGVAVLIVVLSHMGSSGFQLGLVPHDAIGKMGVWIFFGLSAYLLTSRLVVDLEMMSPVVAVSRYMVHRVFRIYPLYIFVIFLHFAIGDFDARASLNHIILFEGRGELWAIPAEFQYYLVIPLIAILPRGMSFLFIFLGVCCSLIVGVFNSEAVFSNEIFFLPKAAPFFFGSLAALLKLDLKKPAIWASACLAIFFFCLITYRCMFVTSHVDQFFKPWLSLIAGFSVAVLIVSALHRCFWSDILCWKPLVWIGQVSFGIYLLHMFVINMLKSLGFSATFGALICLAISAFLGWLANVCIEQPGIGLGRNVSGKII